MSHQHYPVPTPAGALSVMPCPPGADARDVLSALKTMGVSHIVSMLPMDEAEALGVADEAEICADLGLGFLSYPIKDYGLPEIAPFTAFIQQIAALLTGNAHVAVHCQAGIGRSGMVAASALVALGALPQSARETVSAARGVPIPDTEEQGTVISEIVARLPANS